MTARSFLVAGLLVGLLAGVAAFLVAHQVGEPHVETAIALEESAAAPADEADAAESEEAADDGATEVSRSNQRTFGLATGTLAVGTVLGGFVGLLAAAAVGRLGRMTPVQSTLAVAAIGFASYSLVPFLKYPATPPAVGSGDTIGSRTTSYFLLVLVSVVVALAAVQLARRATARWGGLLASVAAGVGYVVVMAIVASLLPTVNEVGAFPADTLWSFRMASLLTLVTMWAVIALGLAVAVDRMTQRERERTARRELAASL